MTASMSTVIVKRDRGVAIITINWPDLRNAVDIPTAETLITAFQACERGDASSPFIPQTVSLSSHSEQAPL